MDKLKELEDALKASMTHFDETSLFFDNLKQAEHDLEVTIESIYTLNCNGTGISTEPLHDILCTIQDKIKSADLLLTNAQRASDIAQNNLKLYRRAFASTLQRNREGVIHMDSHYTAVMIVFSTIDVNKATVNLANGSIVEVFFYPNTDEIDYDLTKGYYHTKGKVW